MKVRIIPSYTFPYLWIGAVIGNILMNTRDLKRAGCYAVIELFTLEAVWFISKPAVMTITPKQEEECHSSQQ